MFRDRIVECDFASSNHVGQQQRGENLCYRADLKHRVAIHMV
jgi:hypothetical protein